LGEKVCYLEFEQSDKELGAGNIQRGCGRGLEWVAVKTEWCCGS